MPPHTDGDHGKFLGMGPTKPQYPKSMVVGTRAVPAAPVPVAVHCWRWFGPTLTWHWRASPGSGRGKVAARMIDSVLLSQCELAPARVFHDRLAKFLLGAGKGTFVAGIGKGAVLGAAYVLRSLWASLLSTGWKWSTHDWCVQYWASLILISKTESIKCSWLE